MIYPDMNERQKRSNNEKFSKKIKTLVMVLNATLYHGINSEF